MNSTGTHGKRSTTIFWTIFTLSNELSVCNDADADSDVGIGIWFSIRSFLRVCFFACIIQILLSSAYASPSSSPSLLLCTCCLQLLCRLAKIKLNSERDRVHSVICNLSRHHSTLSLLRSFLEKFVHMDRFIRKYLFYTLSALLCSALLRSVEAV